MHIFNFMLVLPPDPREFLLILGLDEIDLVVLFFLELSHGFFLKVGFLYKLALIHIFLIDQFLGIRIQLSIDNLKLPSL